MWRNVKKEIGIVITLNGNNFFKQNNQNHLLQINN